MNKSSTRVCTSFSRAVFVRNFWIKVWPGWSGMKRWRVQRCASSTVTEWSHCAHANIQSTSVAHIWQPSIGQCFAFFPIYFFFFFLGFCLHLSWHISIRGVSSKLPVSILPSSPGTLSDPRMSLGEVLSLVAVCSTSTLPGREKEKKENTHPEW